MQNSYVCFSGVHYQRSQVHFIFSHCGLGSPLGVRGKYWKKRKNEMHPRSPHQFFRITQIPLNDNK